MKPDPRSDADLSVLAASFNLRDIGGVETRDGRRVRRGIVFRSAEPRSLDEAASALLDELGIAVVCDMRAHVERRFRPVEHPGYLRAGLIISEMESSNADLWAHLKQVEVSAEDVRGTMVEVYRRLPDEQGPAVRDMVIAVAEGRVPLLFHCAAGKDRTGFAAAVLLALAGVADETILADYVLTERWMATQEERFLRKRRERGESETAWAPLFACDPAYLLTSLDLVRAGPGGLEGWLEAIGVAPGQIESAREQLLETA